jgi:hypothetical protein
MRIAEYANLLADPFSAAGLSGLPTMKRRALKSEQADNSDS